jgi:hypothetical protein
MEISEITIEIDRIGLHMIFGIIGSFLCGLENYIFCREKSTSEQTRVEHRLLIKKKKPGTPHDGQ